MKVDLNQICDCGAELTFDSNIDGHVLDNLQDDQLYKTVCPECGEHWQFRESDVIIKKFYVYGSGIAESELIRQGESSEEATEYAISKGMKFDIPDDWAVEIETTGSEMDVATRFDSNVHGYREVE